MEPHSERALRTTGARMFAAGVVLAIALVAIAIAGGGVAIALRCWLVAWLGLLLISVGSLGMLMLADATHGEWGIPLRRIYEAAASPRVFLLLAVGALPLLIGMAEVFPWVGRDENWYRTPAFFVVRTVLYFAIWIAFSFALRRSSWAQDADSDPASIEQREGWRATVAAPGIVAYFFTTFFATVDFLMSLQPEWTSTIYGLLFAVMAGMAAHTFALAFLRARSNWAPYRELLNRQITRDFGNLLLTILLLWAYFTFSQYIVMWSGDIQREVSYYTMRPGGWDLIAIAIVVTGFFGPLLALTTPRVKASILPLGLLAQWMLFIDWLNLYWMVAPPLVRMAPTPMFPILVLLCFLTIGAFWRWAFFGALRQAPLIPIHDSHWRRTEHVPA